jgi:hypothetical protein
MIEKMEEYGCALCDADIDRIESHFGIKLPQDYRTFLLRYNGGRPTPAAFPIRGLANNLFGGIHFFFGIEGPFECYDLDSNFDTFAGRMPANLLPIACTGCGDMVCLSLFGEDAGAVLFWDHEAEHSPPTYANVYKIASSFSDFITGIFRWCYQY